MELIAEGLVIVVQPHSNPSGRRPNVTMEFFPALLWRAGWINAVKDWIAWFSDFSNVRRTTVSYVELAADILLREPLCRDDVEQGLCTKAEPGYYGSPLTSVRAGKKPCALNLYDKFLKATRDRTIAFWLTVWQLPLDGLRQHVWRVEFQLSRPALLDFGVSSINDLMAESGNLWSRLTGASLDNHAFATLRRSWGNQQKCRRPLTPLWNLVQDEARLFETYGSRALSVVSSRNPDTFVTQILGGLSSYAAAYGESDHRMVFRMFMDDTRRLMSREDWKAKVEAKMIRQPGAEHPHRLQLLPVPPAPTAAVLAPVILQPPQVRGLSPQVAPQDGGSC